MNSCLHELSRWDRMETCPYDASLPTMLASRAPIGPSVLRIGMEKLDAPHWEWIDCHDRPLADAETRFPKRTTWREPPVGPALCCMPPRGCFRAVLDDVIPMTQHEFKKGQKVLVRQSIVRPSPSAGWQLGRVAALEPRLRVRLSSSSNRTGELWDEVRPASTGDDDLSGLDVDVHADAMAEAARRLLVQEGGMRDADLVLGRQQRQASHYRGDAVDAHAWHFDYGQYPRAVFSAIMYTSVDGSDAPLVGGHTAFVDTPPPPLPEATDSVEAGLDTDSVEAGLERRANGTAYLHRGLVVAPRPGRVVLFSGGSENYHAPMPVAQGRRLSVLAWFECACKESKAATSN